MKWKITFNNSVNPTLCTLLQEIFDYFEQYKNRYEWSILDFEAIGDLGDGESIPEFQSSIIDSKTGLLITWDEMRKKLQNLDQIIDLLIAATEDKTEFIKFKSDSESYSYYPFIIDVLDGGELIIISDIEDFIIRLTKRYQKVIKVEEL